MPDDIISRRLAVTAFHHVLHRKQSKFSAVLDWLNHQIRTSAPIARKEAVRLAMAVSAGEAVFRGYKY